MRPCQMLQAPQPSQRGTRDFYSRLNTATLETLTNSDEIREIISGKDLLRAQPDAPTPPSSELIRLMEARVARELRKARQ